MSEKRGYDREEIYSKVVKAGKRTYYFDVRTTKAEDYYLTITESRRQNNPDGSSSVKKHKIFLYKEDFVEFRESLDHVLDFIKDRQGENNNLFERASKRVENPDEGSNDKDGFSQIEFEDL